MFIKSIIVFMKNIQSKPHITQISSKFRWKSHNICCSLQLYEFLFDMYAMKKFLICEDRSMFVSWKFNQVSCHISNSTGSFYRMLIIFHQNVGVTICCLMPLIIICTQELGSCFNRKKFILNNNLKAWLSSCSMWYIVLY